MSDSLIEQVKRLACVQLPGVGIIAHIDFPALLAHLERAQAVVDAARELWGIDMGDWYEVPAKHYEELVAALENLENNDTKAGG